MSDLDKATLGGLIQRYVRAKTSPKPDRAAVAELAGSLDPALVDQLDALGSDAERLLRIDPSAVLAEIRELEREAAREDAGAASAAARTRLQENMDGGGHAQGPRGRPMRPRRPDQPARRRTRRQRGER